MQKSKTTKLATRYLFLLVFVILFGLSFLFELPDPDSGPSISCTSFMSCPGAKMDRGFPIPYSYYTDDGVSYQQTQYALSINVPFFLIISAGVTIYYTRRVKRG